MVIASLIIYGIRSGPGLYQRAYKLQQLSWAA